VKLDFGEFGINKINQRDIENWIKLLLTESRGTYKNGKEKGPYQPASVRRFYYALKTAVEWHSMTYKYHVDEHLFNLAKKVVPAAWDGKRERRLAQGEEERLYLAGIDRENTYTKEDWEGIVGFALETALRLQELVLARWTNLRQDDYKLFIPKEHSKTNTDRVVLLSGKARAIVAAQRTKCPQDEPRIFYQVSSPHSLSKSFASLTKRAAIVDLHFHDLRHEATSRLCEKGVLNLMQLMEMTGHSSMATFKGYLHLLKHENSVTLA
jgi:integrase